MIAFWILAALAAALAGWTILFAARRAVSAPPSAADVGAPELDELDRLRERELIDEDAWTEARAEAGRRLLADAKQDRAAPRSREADRLAVLIGLVVSIAAAATLYLVLGRPGLADQPYARRVEAWAQSTEPLEPGQVAAVLTREARARPDDPRILDMLGAARFQAGDAIGAVSAFRRAVARTPDDARLWARLGESLVRSQDGVVGADAEAAFLEAVKRDPGQLGALYFLGEAALARGDAATARARWTPLIAALDPADPRRADLIERLRRAGAAA